MPHYFLMRSPREDYQLCDSKMPTQKNGLERSMLRKGARLNKDQVSEPIIANLRYPDDVMAEMFVVPLMFRDDLVEDLLNFGVDNIDTYECHLIDEKSGKVWKNYKVVNIIGAIDVFDMEASELHPDSPPDVAYLFNNIVIDEKKAKGHHIFRPYGRMTQIMISEDLKQYLENTGKYKHLEFVAPEDFA